MIKDNNIEAYHGLMHHLFQEVTLRIVQFMSAIFNWIVVARLRNKLQLSSDVANAQAQAVSSMVDIEQIGRRFGK